MKNFDWKDGQYSDDDDLEGDLEDELGEELEDELEGNVEASEDVVRRSSETSRNRKPKRLKRKRSSLSRFGSSINYSAGLSEKELGMRKKHRELYHGPSISADEVLDFHFFIEGVYGIDKGERNFFERMKNYFSD